MAFALIVSDRAPSQWVLFELRLGPTQRISSLCALPHPIVGVVEDGLHSLAGSDDGLPGSQREGKFLAKAGGREERANVADAGILCALHRVQCKFHEWMSNKNG